MEGQEVTHTVFHFTQPRQQRIHRRLSIVGPGPASFYQDASRFMSDPYTYRSTTHLVGHLLREIESGLRAVLETASDEVIVGQKGS